MKRTVALLLLAFSFAFAQEKPAEPAKPAAEPAKEEAKPAEAPAAESPAAEGAAAPEPMVRGSVEVGYRMVGRIGGSQDVYRSVVNLGEGVRLLNLDLSMSPSLKWIDDLAIRANNWGGDPYNSTHFRAGKKTWYQIDVDYRNIAYFNNLPSFANPRLETGLLQSQRSFDMTRRYTDVNIDIMPGRTVTPYFGYTHDAGFGRGVTLFVPSFNEYPVPTDLDDSTNSYRTGVRVEMSRFHATLEAGRFIFSDDQRVYETQQNSGNRTGPYLGQQLQLRTLSQQYGISGDANFTRMYVTANPTNFIDVFGSWMWTRPDIKTSYIENATGNFVQAGRFLPTQQLLFNSMSKQPHNQAHFGFEVRPSSRVRVIQSMYFDRMFTDSRVDRLDVNYQQHQVEVLVDATDRLTVRGGHRYTWGDGSMRSPQLAAMTGFETGKLRRQTGLAGATYRFAQKLTASVDAEVARGPFAYFRTSLRNYERYRARARYQVTQNLQVGWNAAFLNNQNPSVFARPALGDYDLTTLDHSYNFVWTPAGGSKFRASGEYARLNWKSDILFVAPQDGVLERSEFRENGHAGTMMFDFMPVRGAGFGPRFSAGGSFFRSSGSRPTRYLQPMIRAAFPLHKKVEFVGEWRYFGMSQPYFVFDHFRNNQATLSLRFYQ